MNFTPSDRLKNFPPYIFSEINAIKADAERRGVRLLSMAIGDPDQPTPAEIVSQIRSASEKAANHAYSSYEGTRAFREAVVSWFNQRFGVELHPSSETLALIGSKEGIAHFPLSILNPGDTALFPSPGYPIFETSILMAGASAVPLPHRASNRFLPDPDEFLKLVEAHRPKLAILNFPSNPTSAQCDRTTLEELVSICASRGVALAYDNAYSEIYFEKKPLSVLEIPGAQECAIEFHSLSKTFNMTGWRIGFAVGNASLVNGLLKVKTNVDSGPLLAVQEASQYALLHAARLGDPIRSLYQSRRDAMVSGLRKLGLEFEVPEATFYLWIRVPGGGSSMQFARALIEHEGLVVTPGIGFGKEGEGFFRLALTVGEDAAQEALTRLERFLRTKKSGG